MRSAPIVLALADTAVLVALRPDPAALLARLSAPRSWLEQDGADAVFVRLAGAGLWLVAAWIAFGLIASAAATAPGAVGRLAHRVSIAVLPRVLQRVLIGSAGLGVLLAPAAAQARSHWVPAPVTDRVVATAGVDPAPGPVWPISEPLRAGVHPTAPPPTPTRVPHPGPTWPATSNPNRPTTPAAPGSDIEGPSGVPTRGTATTAPPQRPAAHPTTTHPAPPRRGEPDTSASAHIQVRTGDALWLLAAHRLGAGASEHAITQYWPRIFAANRAVIGDDPDLIQPGQQLRLPTPTSQETP